jgi:hypothetical protein
MSGVKSRSRFDEVEGSSVVSRRNLFDSIVLSAILILSLLIVIIIFAGDRSTFRVSKFDAADKQIGIQDRSISLSFNRPVDSLNINNNFKIIPEIPGKINWKNNKLVYSFTEIPTYATNYRITLAGLKEAGSNKLLASFQGQFKTRDRLLVYVGIQAKERGRLILFNQTKNQKNILTPPDLLVTNFEIYPNSDKILFAGLDNSDRGQEVGKQQLYTVTTGVDWQASDNIHPAGRIELILDSQNYQNQKFDLSADGKIIIVQRSNLANPGDSGLWIVPAEGKPRPLGISGTQFLIAPNGKTLAVAQGKGILMLALTPDAASSQQFIPSYGKVLSFSEDSSQKLVVKYNRDYSQSLSLITEANNIQNIFKSSSPIADCQFNPNNQNLIYCLKTENRQIEGVAYEEPVLVAIDLKTLKSKSVAVVPDYQDVKMSISPDGKVILFDRTITTPPRTNSELLTDSGGAIASASLWLLPLDDIYKTPPQQIAIGFRPKWLP